MNSSNILIKLFSNLTTSFLRSWKPKPGDTKLAKKVNICQFKGKIRNDLFWIYCGSFRYLGNACEGNK